MKSITIKRIIYWVLTGLIAIVFLGSAAGKFSANEKALKIAAGFGLDAKTYTILGMVELLSIVLFIIPRTGMIGTLLLTAYMGGAIASHLEHSDSIIAPCIVQTLMLLVAFYRFPELRTRLLNINP